jgi:hypothetical protein
MIMAGAAYLAAGYLLQRLAADPVRAGLIWAANPLLIYLLVMGAQLDVFVALAGIAAILISRHGTTVWHDLTVGTLIGVGGAIKINAAFVALGIAVPLIRERAWARLLRTAAASMAATSGLYFSYGASALKPLPNASGRVISPTFWRLFQIIGDYLADPATIDTLIGVLWPPLLLVLAWYLYNRLSPDVPAVLAATCALTFAWVLVAPWSLPWYTAVAWVTLALLPRNSLTRWLTLATMVPALVHFSAGHTRATIRPLNSEVLRWPGCCQHTSGCTPASQADGDAHDEGGYRLDRSLNSIRPSAQRITRVFPCIACGFKARASFMSAGCC